MTTVRIRAAGPADQGPLTATLAAAFAHGPVADWLIPEHTARPAIYLATSRILFEHALAHGLIDTTTDHTGAAVWYPHPPLPPGADPAGGGPTGGDPAGGGLVGGLPGLLGEAADRYAMLEATLAAAQPGQPHHHLAYLGVHPEQQSQGLGSALLAHHHRHLDTTATPAFLVATSQRSRDLYRRHGYTVRAVLTLPAGPPLWTMWRDPERRT